MFRRLLALWIVACPSWVLAVEPEKAASAAKAAIATFKLPKGVKAELFAVEPQVGNPVAIALDEQGRLFVAEEYRFNLGTEENRTRPFLLEDDLQLQTIEDRLAMYRKFADRFEGGMAWFTKHADRVQLVEDRDGDGRADHSQTFAEFQEPLDGLVAGVLPFDGDIYVTCIPNLWRLRDKDGDGRAEQREVVHRGFGVNAAFLGHDLHGLAWGPDGRLYFSVGDRGFHVETREGKTLHGPRTGAVFRCESDGSHLEVVHRGLRNPQELAFDDFGNLFADDNNCDKGDRSRLVYVVEGGESGWNMANQTLVAPYLTGPWHAEKTWSLADKQQPAWIVPPVGHLGAGPSGFAYYPGVGLPERYRGHFFMADYTGNGGLESFAVQPDGASFRMVDDHRFMEPLRPTDVEFGYDGKLYVSELPNLDWNGGKPSGRVYTVFDPALRAAPIVEQTRQLFQSGFKQRSSEELTGLLSHADLRVRQRAQFALAARGDEATKIFQRHASSKDPLSRLHAIWGLWQQARKTPEVAKHLPPLLDDADPEVRAQVVRVLGDVRYQPTAAKLVALLADSAPRVRFFAAIGLGRLEHRAAVGPLTAMLRANDNRDLYLRHAGVMGLVGCTDTDGILTAARDPSPAVRMAALLAMRRRSDARVAMFLDDAEMPLVMESARAINDLSLDQATPALAKALPRGAASAEYEPLMRRAINAHFRLGTTENAQAIVKVVSDERATPLMRAEALAALGDWTTPGPRDRVTGFWRPLPPREPSIVRGVLAESVALLLARTSGDLQAAAIKLIVRQEIKTDDDSFFAMVNDPARPVNTRIEALRLLAARRHAKLPQAIETALAAESPRLRAEGRDVLATIEPESAVKKLNTLLNDASATVIERQRAFTTLGAFKASVAEPLLIAWAEKLAEGKVSADLQLDVSEALAPHTQPAIVAALAKFKKTMPEKFPKFGMSLVGGDAERGRAIFTGNATAQCIRCHKIRGEGGTAGPDLTQVATRNTRLELLHSMLDPNAKIALGFATVTLVRGDGTLVAGVVKHEDAKSVTIETPTGEKVTVPTAEIEDRTSPTSAMPSVERALTPNEVRDLMEFLSTLR
ncbi:MAG: HEAT repeat domain-containing protein [Planctomycetia bacterium]|nr:HEAT repeat domain-containing protein [Planctomycetia bacterium]